LRLLFDLCTNAVAAQKINGIIMTGDPEFEEVTKLAKVEWLKKRK